MYANTPCMDNPYLVLMNQDTETPKSVGDCFIQRLDSWITILISECRMALPIQASF